MVPPWSLLLMVATTAAVRCPDGTKCGDKKLCCELPDGNGFGCCPENEVVSRSLPMITSEVSCSDKGCPEEYSCVGTPQGRSACCPFEEGISCQDGHHCCPSGSHCSEDGHCVPASNLSAIICPDGISECPNDATCCQMVDQSWGCCPIPQATCCKDHVHCCPHTSVCDLEHDTCVSENGEVPLFKKIPARVKLVSAAKVQEANCSDGSSCPDGTTCCQNVDKHYGCCPFLSAVCCDDLVHCCPSGTICDIPRKKCVNANFEIPMYSKIPTLHEKATVKCDETASCPGTDTCCRLPSGEWGCCAYEKAVCCDDHEHCCPNGFTCVQGQCQQQAMSIPWSEKRPAIKQKSADIQCDETTSCPDNSTCCKLQSGEWGCCPYEQATCCPSELKCDEQTTCLLGQFSTPRFGKINVQAPEVKCDKSHSCAQGTTCCHTEGGGWACCPLEEAVCCSDHLHCCPSGYTCDLASGTCNKPSGALKKFTPIQPLDYVWCDTTHACYDGQTCCIGLGGIWTCCPYPQGVCCPDRVHCCPYGHVCLNHGAQCSRSGSLRWDLLFKELKPRL